MVLHNDTACMFLAPPTPPSLFFFGRRRFDPQEGQKDRDGPGNINCTDENGRSVGEEGFVPGRACDHVGVRTSPPTPLPGQPNNGGGGGAGPFLTTPGGGYHLGPRTTTSFGSVFFIKFLKLFFQFFGGVTNKPSPLH